MNIAKTKLLVLNNDRLDSDLSTKQGTIKNSPSYEYLGVFLEDDLT